MAALYAVRERFRPEARPLLDDLNRVVALYGADVVALKARELGIERHVELALDPLYHPWVAKLKALDAKFPKMLSALPALVTGGLRGFASFMIAAVLLGLGHLARRAQKPSGDGGRGDG